MSEPLRVAYVAAERVPLAKVGGLADVAGALTEALAARGHAVRCYVPAYRDSQIPEAARREVAIDLDVPFGAATEPARIERVRLPGSRVEILLVDHLGPRAFFDRPGIYNDPASGEPYPDGGERYVFFCRAVCEAMRRLGHEPDIVHLNDFHTAFVAAFLRAHYAQDPALARAACVYTIHNLGYLGLFPPSILDVAGIPRAAMYVGSPYEFWGQVNATKVVLEMADLITTVSPRYAQEIRSGPDFGSGLEGVLERRAADLIGILNGIDVETWNPATDLLLPARYSIDDLRGKSLCRAALAHEAGWPADSPWPIAGMITRLTEQKGFDLLEAAAADLSRLEMRLFVLGTGEASYEEMLASWQRAYPDRVHVRRGFDEPLAHRIEAGADLFLMPSRYEPCGLNQMMSQRYGTVPVVRAVGGLVDTVTDFDPETRTGTGFLFEAYAPEAMVAALKRALAIYRQPHVWRHLMTNGMQQDFSWERSARRYEEAYREARTKAAARR